ncbi:MAG TPA: hypothetical protein VK781_12740 [Solirubrobacteraceae bacterium]|jgi:hypothetical protein|nr:hypothetical protein [Solirubrobacteraceae bacterium]
MSADPAHNLQADGRSPESNQPSASLERLRALLFEEGGLMRGLVSERPGDALARSGESHEPISPDGLPQHDGQASISPGREGPAGIVKQDSHAVWPPAVGPAQLAASGPRMNGRAADYELLLEAIYEGYLLHYRAPRVVQPVEDDLGLLAGDRLYALGLSRLVKLGDIEAVAELADVITLSALAHAGGKPELADAVWMAGARAVGWGASPHHERAKSLVRAGSPAALEALRNPAPA